jgi:hypothetical protein
MSPFKLSWKLLQKMTEFPQSTFVILRRNLCGSQPTIEFSGSGKKVKLRFLVLMGTSIISNKINLEFA